MDLSKFYTDEWPGQKSLKGPIDVITPGWAFLRDWLSGGAAHWGISIYAGATDSQIRDYLKSYGIKTWGMMLSTDGNTWMFATPKVQAREAAYLFQEAGLRVEYTPRCAFE
jgi:hypothetical protein